MHGGGERANCYAARQNGRGIWQYNQLPATALKRLSNRIRTSCSDQLADSAIPCGYPLRSKKALLEEQISTQLCCKCRAIIVRLAGIPCTLMTLTLSVSRLGKSHADAVLSGADCSHCECFSLASLCLRLAFFSESGSTNCALPFPSSQGSVRKTLCRGFERPVTSELPSAQ